MIRIGICTGWERASLVASLGYDYIELSLSATAAMEDVAFEEARAALADSPVRAEAFNSMMPPSLRLIGPDVDLVPVREYLTRAIPRAAALGAQVIVFGSGGARRVPERWAMDSAWAQLTDFLRLCLPILEEHCISLAIEPLSRSESNIIHTVREAAALAAAVSYPYEGELRFSSSNPRVEQVNDTIGALGDTYHMAANGDPFESFVAVSRYLKHVHTAESLTRAYPRLGDGTDYTGLFAALADARYEKRVSVEGKTDDFEVDAPAALEALKDARGKFS